MSIFTKMNFYGGLLSLCLATQALAAPLVNWTSAPNTNNSGPWVLGFEFTVGAAGGTVSGLGAFDNLGDGFLNDHIVCLWTSAGALLASTNVTSSDPLDLITGTSDGFRYAAITPITLTAGNYVVAASDWLGDVYAFDAPGFSILPGFSYVTDRYESTSGLVFPTQGTTATNGYFGANLQISDAPELDGNTAALPLAFVFLCMAGLTSRRPRFSVPGQ